MAGDSWAEWPFENVIDFQEGPGILAKDFRDVGVPLVRLSGLDRGASVLAGCNFLDPEMIRQRWSHFALAEGDILLSTSASLGRIAVVGKEAVGAVAYTGIIRMRPRDERVFAPFIRYLLEGPDFQRQAEMAGVGSVIRHFGPMHLRRMTVTLPPQSEQRTIAHILGTLDDKIELNQRMNETLEGMARAIFKSWFVDFDPVRAKMRGEQPAGPAPEIAALFPDALVETELGEAPEGWEIGAVQNLGSIVCGKTPPTADEDNYGHDVPFVTIPDMHGKVFVTATSKALSLKGAATQSTKYLPPYSIPVSCIATPGLVALTSTSCQTNQQINSVIPADPDTSIFCYFVLRGLGDQIRSHGAGGSVLLNVNKGQFSAMRVLLPPERMARIFQSITRPIFDRVLNNEIQNEALAALRDTLLPKLISGELRVADAERIVGATA